MDTQTALQQVNSTITQLQVALKDRTLTPQEKKLIQQAINDQMDLQDTLTNQVQQAMVDKINASNTDLQKMITKMQATSDKLGKLAASIKKVSDVIGTLASVTSQAISNGLLGGA